MQTKRLPHGKEKFFGLPHLHLFALEYVHRETHFVLENINPVTLGINSRYFYSIFEYCWLSSNILLLCLFCLPNWWLFCLPDWLCTFILCKYREFKDRSNNTNELTGAPHEPVRELPTPSKIVIIEETNSSHRKVSEISRKLSQLKCYGSIIAAKIQTSLNLFTERFIIFFAVSWPRQLRE